MKRDLGDGYELDDDLDEHRGRGLGVELAREIVENGPYADRRWVLIPATHIRSTGSSASARTSG